MSAISTSTASRTRQAQLRHQFRILRVLAGADFKLKYAGSFLGYVWSVVKPLALFSMLYAVFGRVFHLGAISHFYPLALLIGIVLFTFFQDATTIAMYSFVARATLLRKISFPRLVVPVSATLTAALPFGVNALVILAFVAFNKIEPQPDWLLIIPLMIEL